MAFFLAMHHVACGILVLQPGIKLGPLAMKAWTLNHWTTREFPYYYYYFFEKVIGKSQQMKEAEKVMKVSGSREFFVDHKKHKIKALTIEGILRFKMKLSIFSKVLIVSIHSF